MGRKTSRGKGKELTDFSHLIKVDEKNVSETKEGVIQCDKVQDK